MCGWFTWNRFNNISCLTIQQEKIPTPFVSFWRHPCNSGWVPFGRLKTSKMCLKALPTSNGTRKLNQVLSFGKFFSLELLKTNYYLIIESLSNIRKYVPLFLEKNKSKLTWLRARVLYSRPAFSGVHSLETFWNPGVDLKSDAVMMDDGCGGWLWWRRQKHKIRAIQTKLNRR